MLSTLETRDVDNPEYTAGLYDYHRESRGTASPYQRVTSNAMTRIGALCFIRRREPHHEAAAAEFKGLYESCFGSGTPASNPEREPVDTSFVASDAGMVEMVERAHKLRRAETALTKPRYDRLVALLVLCVPAGEGLHWRDRKDAISEVLLDLDSLAAVWGYMGRRG